MKSLVFLILVFLVSFSNVFAMGKRTPWMGPPNTMNRTIGCSSFYISTAPYLEKWTARYQGTCGGSPCWGTYGPLDVTVKKDKKNPNLLLINLEGKVPTYSPYVIANTWFDYDLLLDPAHPEKAIFSRCKIRMKHAGHDSGWIKGCGSNNNAYCSW